ncbi:hypothetical protein VFC49_10750 [Thermococcus sp. SY098]|uniref:hypothetical protein n=1 Tax=Thermococcus sp. SY098 TaxID=3111325 RepID=UPI002D78966C|nr:hypothetical protein [Thermococcus sp. SY098]WRS52483.1 hypothetical protein VFC49_10750 [Thermococcus sp. SY098]
MKNPKAVHLPLLHGFLTLALVHHMGESSPSIGDAIGDALYDWTDIGKGWEELKKNPEEFAEYVLSYLEQTGSAPINRDATKKVIVQAVQKSAKVLDKMIPSVESLKHLKATSHAVSGAVDDPFVVLRNAGIDIEPELEEFRQFLAEISGKKVSRQKSSELALTVHELLGILYGLKLAGYSEEALNSVRTELWEKIDFLIQNPSDENLKLIGIYASVLRLLEKGEDAEGFLKRIL